MPKWLLAQPSQTSLTAPHRIIGAIFVCSSGQPESAKLLQSLERVRMTTSEPEVNRTRGTFAQAHGKELPEFGTQLSVQLPSRDQVSRERDAASPPVKKQ